MSFAEAHDVRNDATTFAIRIDVHLRCPGPGLQAPDLAGRTRATAVVDVACFRIDDVGELFALAALQMLGPARVGGTPAAVNSCSPAV